MATLESLCIRPAVFDDARSIAVVHVEAWRHAYSGIAPASVLATLSVDDREHRCQHILGHPDDKKHTAVAEFRGEVVGFVSAGPNRGADPGVLGEIYAIYVSPPFQGRGVGRALMAEAASHLAARGCVPFVLWALEGNESGRTFYRSLGGEQVGTGSHAFGDESRPTVSYRWEDADAVRRPAGASSAARDR